MVIVSPQTGAPYVISGTIAPSYIVLSDLCPSPQFSLAVLLSMYVSALDLSAIPSVRPQKRRVTVWGTLDRSFIYPSHPP